MIAYTGSYRLEEDRWITLVDVAWNPSWVGTEQTRFYRVEADQLIVTRHGGSCRTGLRRV